MTWKRFWTPPRLWRLAEMLENGYSDAEIGAHFGVSAEAVNIARKRYDIACRSRQKLTASAAARLLGIESRTVVRWVRHGWLRAQRGPDWGPHRRWMIDRGDLTDFLENPAYWHCWEPSRIPDATGLRWWATEMRAGERFLTLSAVAERYSVQPATVGGWIDRGFLPAVRNGNRLIRAVDLEGFVPPGQRSRAGIHARRFNESEDQRLIWLCEHDGASWAEIARDLGRATGSVSGRYQRLIGRREERMAA